MHRAGALHSDPQHSSAGVAGSDAPPASVRVGVESNLKGRGVHGVVVLLPVHAGPVRVRGDSPADASEAAATIRNGLANHRPVDVTVQGASGAGVAYLLAWAFVFFALFAGIAHSALLGVGRLRLELVHDGARLLVRRTILGVTLASHEVSLDAVADVRVERGSLGEKWLGRREGRSPAARLVVVDRSGGSRPITTAFFPGEAVHLRAAAELRVLLGLERQAGDERLRSWPWSCGSSFEPPPKAP